MNHSSSTNTRTIGPVRVRRHPVDWEGADFDEVTLHRALDLGPGLGRGAWYLNPRFTVTCPDPTAEFFRRVIELRASWLRTCRQVQGTYGQRQQARKAERLGRRAAFVELDPLTASGAQPQLPPEVIPLSALTEATRREVVQRGRLARQATFSGILFLDGELIPPRTWQAQADALLVPDSTPRLSNTHRHLDLAALQANGNLDPLEQLARSALQAHLADRPTHAAYVLPHVTISAPVATPAFYAAAAGAQEQWRILLNRTLGKAHARQARQGAEPEAHALVFGGTLVLDGQLYHPRTWPNQTPGEASLVRTLFQAPTAPPIPPGLTPFPGPAENDFALDPSGTGTAPHSSIQRHEPDP